MQAVILAAGRGTRMRELTETIPKPMIPILGKPLLEWKILALPQELTEVIVTIGYLGEQIIAHFGEEFDGRKMTYVTQEELNGTGSSFRTVEPCLTGPALVTNGDDLYVTQDLEKLSENDFAVLGRYTEEAQRFGLIEINEKNELVQITECPHAHSEGYINIGAYMIGQEFFRYPLVAISETEYGLPQTLATMVGDIPIPVLIATDWQPVGCPEDLPLAEAFIAKYYQNLL